MSFNFSSYPAMVRYATGYAVCCSGGQVATAKLMVSWLDLVGFGILAYGMLLQTMPGRIMALITTCLLGYLTLFKIARD